jgi:hypothetical protein
VSTTIVAAACTERGAPMEMTAVMAVAARKAIRRTCCATDSRHPGVTAGPYHAVGRRPSDRNRSGGVARQFARTVEHVAQTVTLLAAARWDFDRSAQTAEPLSAQQRNSSPRRRGRHKAIVGPKILHHEDHEGHKEESLPVCLRVLRALRGEVNVRSAVQRFRSVVLSRRSRAGSVRCG